MTKTFDKAFGFRWQEIDVLRGLAAVMMVVNHLGNKTLEPSLLKGTMAANLVFAGSFAPVLFFFVTGVGYGIQSGHKKKPLQWYSIVNKAIILFLADLLMHWSNGNLLGLDFLGFIALSSLVLEFVRRSKFPLVYCGLGVVLIAVMRYLIGPVVHNLGYDTQMGGVLGWVFGTYAVKGVSYPLSPWLAYPFAGYLTGAAATHFKSFILSYRWRVILGLLLLGSLSALAGMILSGKGASFFRWGTVGIGFFVVSFAAVFWGLALSLCLCTNSHFKNLQKFISLKGTASLAVVPVHYFLIYVLAVILGIKPLGLLTFCLIAIVALTVSFLLARSVESLSEIIRERPNQKQLWFALVAVLFLSVAFTLIASQENPLLAIWPRTIGQILLCLLFVVRWPL